MNNMTELWNFWSTIQTVEELDEILSKNNLNINAKISLLGDTPLMLHTQRGNIDIVKYMISKGANIHDTAVGGWSAFHAICKFGHIDLFDYFVNDLKMTLKPEYLRRACFEGQIDIVKGIFNNQNEIDITPDIVHAACIIPRNNIYHYRSKDILIYLIIHGADLNSYYYGETPLTLSIKYENLHTVKVLLDMGVDVTVKNSQNMTPQSLNEFLLSENNNNAIQLEIAELLKHI